MASPPVGLMGWSAGRTTRWPGAKPTTPSPTSVTSPTTSWPKTAGARVAVINPYREPGLERYWIPSVTESALFGTKIADAFFQVHTGGDKAFIAGAMAAELGLTSDPNPNPIGPGLLAFFTFWPAVILIVWGLIASVLRYRRQAG
jgi:hypothetical protein